MRTTTKRLATSKSGENGNAAAERTRVTVPPPRMCTIRLRIRGATPYMQCRFSEKAQLTIMSKQTSGDQPAKRRARPPRNYEDDYRGAMHKMEDGSIGIPASAFRAAAISACRLVNFKMTIAKLSIFIVADGLDVVDKQPLVRIFGKPEMNVMMGRNADGMPDVRVRPLFQKWHAELTVRFDEDQFSVADVVNLFMRIGMQVGIGEGRPDSKKSAGLGFGLFDVEQ